MVSLQSGPVPFILLPNFPGLHAEKSFIMTAIMLNSDCKQQKSMSKKSAAGKTCIPERGPFRKSTNFHSCLIVSVTRKR
jgi:hypothetical protein